jgi:hypothetical protein
MQVGFLCVYFVMKLDYDKICNLVDFVFLNMKFEKASSRAQSISLIRLPYDFYSSPYQYAR